MPVNQKLAVVASDGPHKTIQQLHCINLNSNDHLTSDNPGGYIIFWSLFSNVTQATKSVALFENDEEMEMVDHAHDMMVRKLAENGVPTFDFPIYLQLYEPEGGVPTSLRPSGTKKGSNCHYRWMSE